MGIPNDICGVCYHPKIEAETCSREDCEVSSASLLDAAKELKRAIEFYDRVLASSEDEQIAVGRDHFDWVFRAARKVVNEASNAKLSNRANHEKGK